MQLNLHRQTIKKNACITDLLFFFWNAITENFFWARTPGMERLEEYANEGSPLNEQSNSRREPIKEEITNNSSELLQTVK